MKNNLNELELATNKLMDRAIELSKQSKQSFIDAQQKYLEMVKMCDDCISNENDKSVIKTLKNKRAMAFSMAKSLNIDIKK